MFARFSVFVCILRFSAITDSKDYLSSVVGHNRQSCLVSLPLGDVCVNSDLGWTVPLNPFLL